jgi:hypothetical protein
MWEQLRLTSEGAIDRVHVRLEQEVDGWTLWISHRHVGGVLGDCAQDYFERLTLGEAMDVLEATIATEGH